MWELYIGEEFTWFDPINILAGVLIWWLQYHGNLKRFYIPRLEYNNKVLLLNERRRALSLEREELRYYPYQNEEKIVEPNYIKDRGIKLYIVDILLLFLFSLNGLMISGIYLIMLIVKYFITRNNAEDTTNMYFLSWYYSYNNNIIIDPIIRFYKKIRNRKKLKNIEVAEDW